jgi:hypothetical protein
VDEHEVERPRADDLVGDAHVPAARVGNLALGIGARLRRLELRILLQHAALQLAQRRRGLDPELVREHAPERLEGCERLRLAA